MTANLPILEDHGPPLKALRPLPQLHQRFTREGTCQFRKVPLEAFGSQTRFWAHWNANKRSWMERGFSLGRDNGIWYVQQWLTLDGTLTAVGAEVLAKLVDEKTQSQRELILPPAELKLDPLPEGLEAKLFEYQRIPARQIFRALTHGETEWGYPGAVDFSEVGVGKAQPCGTPVLTPNGWRTIETLSIGDWVISADGKSSRVIGVHPRGQQDVWRVTFSDGTSTRCCGDHLWKVETTNHRQRGQEGPVLSTTELLRRGLDKKPCGSKWFIPLTQPVEFAPLPEENYPLDPYLLGVLLGDGCFVASTPRVSIPDREMLEALAECVPPGFTLRHLKDIDYSLSAGIQGKRKPNAIAEALRRLGLWGKSSAEKFVPDAYLFASIGWRHSLLQGLLDTDGSAVRTAVEYSTTSEALAGHVCFLAQSLGGTARMVSRQTFFTHKGVRKAGLPSWRILVCLPSGFAPFRLRRKAREMRDRTKYPVKRAIRSIEPDGVADCVCISIAHPSQLYLTNDCIVTHNSYMTLAAALATGRKVAVLCPPAGHVGWGAVFAHFGVEPYFLESYEAVRGNWRPEIVRRRSDGWFEWQNPNEFVLILDEAQAVRHDESLTARCCASAIWQKVPIIAASATAAVTPLELRLVGRIVGLHKGGEDWERFLSRHGCYMQRKSWKWNRDLRTLSAIHSKLFPRRGCRVRRQHLGEMSPETIIELLPLDVPEAVELDRQWKEAQQLFSTLQAAGTDRRIIMWRQRQAYQAVWRRCEAALVEPVAEHARRELDSGRSVALFVSFTESRLRLGKLLGTSAGFYGGQAKKARRWYLEQFQADRIHALVSNVKSGGASVSLHDIAGRRPRTAYIFASDHVINIEQATGRVDRVGGQSVSRQYIPTVKGTLIEQMVRRTRRKMLGISTLNDGEGSSRI